MDDKQEIIARIKDLARRADKLGLLFQTSFLSLPEQNLFYSLLKDDKQNLFNGVYFYLIGPIKDCERKVLFFSKELLTEMEQAELLDNFSCILVSPKNKKFADKLTHRDFLGALMSLGLERELFGDIYTDGLDGYIYVLKQAEEIVLNELAKVKHTVVDTKIVPLSSCPFTDRFEEKRIVVSSLRIDCLIKEVFHLSRKESQFLISQELVFIDSRTVKNNSYQVKENEVISVRHKGKFTFLRSLKETSKNRLVVLIKLYL